MEGQIPDGCDSAGKVDNGGRIVMAEPECRTKETGEASPRRAVLTRASWLARAGGTHRTAPGRTSVDICGGGARNRRELQAIRPLAYQTYRNFWQVKLPNGWNTASVYLRYDRFTRKFTGAILGTVGNINSDGIPMGTTCTRPFYFPFSGALGPGGSVSQEVTHY